MLEVADLCLRKSWFKRSAKIQEVMKGSAALGTALHGVVERYLLADDLGRGRDGQPVNLYTAGWHVVTERDGQSITLSPAEQILVQKLVDKAIEAGHLVREPGRQIEAEWRIRAPGFEDVVIPGKMDVVVGPSVTDHKTVKSMRWAKSARELAESIQMNLYALAVVERMVKSGEPVPDEVSLSHVAYCKDPDDLRTRVTTTRRPVTAARAFYQTKIRPLIDKMIATENAAKWHDIDPPANMAKACNAYGGCSFASICQGRESVEDYRKRMMRLQAERVDLGALSPATSQETSSMGRFNILSKITQQGTAASIPPAVAGAQAISQTPPAPAAEIAPPVAVPQAASKPGLSSLLKKTVAGSSAAVAIPTVAAPNLNAAPLKTAEPPPPSLPVEVPPWASPMCDACSKTDHPGWNPKGAPCRICDSLQGKAGGPLSTWFVIIGAGREAAWEPKPEYAEHVDAVDAAGGAEIPGTGGEVKVEERDDITKKPLPDAVAAIIENPAPPEEPSAEEERDAALGLDLEDLSVTGKKKTGRPAIGMTILIGCAVTRHGSKRLVIYHFDQVANEAFFQLAQANKAPTYFHMDPFARRDAMARVAGAIAERIGSSWLVVPSSALGSPDHRNLLTCLRPYAGNVIEGTAQ